MEVKRITQNQYGVTSLLVNTLTYHQKTNDITLTVWCKDVLRIGDELVLTGKDGFMKIREIIENRDYKGKFINPDDNKKSYWKLRVYWNRF